MIRRVDAVSYGNAFRSLSPMWKSGFAAAMFVLSFVLDPVLQLAISLWLMIWCIFYAKIPIQLYAILLGSALLFYFISLPVLVVEIGRPATGEAVVVLPMLGSSLSLYMTAAGLWRGGLLLARVAACLSCFFFLILTTPFAELLQVLRRLRMPQIVLELMLIMYRFLFLLSDTAQGMMLARRLRGGTRGFSAKLREAAGMAGVLFAKTVQRYHGLSQGFLTRGFDGDIVLPPGETRPVPVRYAVEAYVGMAVLVLVQSWLAWRL
ncbi:cobalt ECF transporter T component CbiQ [Paenibacillus sp. NPDC057934]|uniref:cobalt ECF transporter T component CbiQ n=1 Tax=Paenibacillus sp. NPDC057934 TaxID=3346282 RepID=UPI0036DD0117